ncbi:hypothetical protein CKA32_000636 [Geitlerinema sp. FC II]|nr:hypothetical protein CKA32_000636 [Geitlerinema sp. FC II]
MPKSDPLLLLCRKGPQNSGGWEFKRKVRFGKLPQRGDR